VNVEVTRVVLEFGHLVDAAESLAECRAFVATEYADHVLDEEGCKASDPHVVEERPGEGGSCGCEFIDGGGVKRPLCRADAGFSAPVGSGGLDNKAFVSIGQGQVEDKVEVVFACDVKGDE